jgi:two-component system cell cycle sensor histidine kinase/response regulator CckA
MLATLAAPQTLAAPHRMAGRTKRPGGILVVDDDEMVRSLLGMFFRQQGLTVWLASDGEEAVEIYEGHGDEIAFVLLDVRMPEMDGPQTLRKIQDANPDVVCYFMSGEWYPYTEAELLDMGAAALLVKPFLFKVLADLVQHCSACAS